MFDSYPDDDDLQDDLKRHCSDIYLDVPYVPSDDTVVEAMLNLADVGPDDILYDLGSGDGRIVVAAALTRNTSGVGIELDPLRVAEAMEYAADSRVEFLVDFQEEDLFEADISEATVVTMYLLHSINIDLRPRLLKQLRPGTRIVSHAFDMGDWEPDKHIEVGGISLYKWIVPAQIAGSWEWEGHDGSRYHVDLRQAFQYVNGRAWRDNEEINLKRAVLRGGLLGLELDGGALKSPRRFTLNFEDSALEPVVEEW